MLMICSKYKTCSVSRDFCVFRVPRDYDHMGHRLRSIVDQKTYNCYVKNTTVTIVKMEKIKND